MKSQRCLVSFLAGALLLLAAQPGLASEQNAVLYEVTEAMKLKSMQSGISRTATASLVGYVNAGTSICPEWLAVYLGQKRCSLTATAHDSVSLVTGVGPVNGTFRVVIAGDNDVDGAELVILEGRINGKVDLVPAILGFDGKPQSGDELPLGSIKGQWRALGARGGPLEGLQVRGTFTGVFRLPFVLPAQLDPTQTPVYLVGPTPQDVVPVEWNEYSLGVPTVMLEITFVDKK
jgi:hypothetical protein